MTDRQLERASLAALALGLAITSVLAVREILPTDGVAVTAAFLAWNALPFGLAWAALRWLRTARPSLRVLAVGLIAGVALSLWTLLDALVLNPAFLSSLWLLILPGMQLVGLAVLVLVAWALRPRTP